ncbi:hypothetical protein B0T10DRAFT_463346 [Thelonectria olida]|uniref:Uncharacterized protein n=1 Tax=Thelonectria olida TaxID=1576542 RepID=A0A9P9AP34_9HYPO|nr:hypothetical protein B0T10DRAFT_463346 [Thelonectria olida]
MDNSCCELSREGEQFETQLAHAQDGSILNREMITNFAGHHDPSRHLDGAQSDPTNPTSPAITYTSRKKNRPRRATTPTWKVKEVGSWNALLARAGQSSHKVRKKKKYTQRGLRCLLVESTKDEGQTQNRFLDAEGEFVGFPSVEEVCAFSSQDWDKLFQALDS